MSNQRKIDARKMQQVADEWTQFVVTGNEHPKVLIEILSHVPCPVVLVSAIGHSKTVLQSPAEWAVLLDILAQSYADPLSRRRQLLYRSVEMSRLQQVVRCGCDVTPTDAPMFATDDTSKALEDYGGPNKVVEVFDRAKMERTFRTVSKQETPENLAKLRRIYPTMKLGSNCIWCTRLQPGDAAYHNEENEAMYGFFIPGDAKKALIMVFLVGEEPERLRAEALASGCGPSSVIH
jgi:hypothetical protein